MEPKYKHDCSRCHFLGRATVDGVEGDVYVCGRTGEYTFRFGDKPEEYKCPAPARAISKVCDELFGSIV